MIGNGETSANISREMLEKKSVEADKRTEIMEQTDRLYNIIDDVTEELKNLENRLNPILRPAEPVNIDECGEVQPECCAPYALTLQMRNSVLEQQLYIIRNIIKRIEI